MCVCVCWGGGLVGGRGLGEDPWCAMATFLIFCFEILDHSDPMYVSDWYRLRSGAAEHINR